MVLAGKIAVVTGGSRGIGRSICLRLAAMGAEVYVNYVARSDAAETVKAEIESMGGQARLIGFNVSDSTAVDEGFRKILEESGTVDILVNNAGITRDGFMARMKESDWDAVMDTNLKGAFLCAKTAGRIMMKKKTGRIVNISSVIGFSGNSGQVNYAAAKAGMVGFTKSMAQEYASRNITVNSVAPGFIKTEMTDLLSEEIQQQIKSRIPLGFFGQGEDVAGAVAFLVSDDARYITGQTLHVNGGMYM